MSEDGLSTDEDGEVRCAWQQGLEDYRRYHDDEWGHPVRDDQRLFEKICLEGFQSGLSWLTILRKRPAFRAAFAGFDIDAVAAFTETDIERCLADKGIVRHRGKIVSTINNARRAVAIRQEFGTLARYVWSFEPPPEERPAVMDAATLRANPTTQASIRLSKDLKKRGFSFVGPTTVYAFMQAMGMVNDHIEGCHCRPRIEALRQEFVRP